MAIVQRFKRLGADELQELQKIYLNELMEIKPQITHCIYFVWPIWIWFQNNLNKWGAVKKADDPDLTENITAYMQMK